MASRTSSTPTAPVTRPSARAASRSSSANNSSWPATAICSALPSRSTASLSACRCRSRVTSAGSPASAEASRASNAINSSMPAPVFADIRIDPCSDNVRCASESRTSLFVHTSIERPLVAALSGAPPDASMSHRTRSADCARARARRTPSASTGSLVSRTPAVSTSTTGTPARSSATSIASRVVPGSAETIATSRAARRLSSVDFPTLGGAGDRHDESIAQSLATAAIVERALDLLAKLTGNLRRGREQVLRHVALIGKIDGRFHERHRLDQPGAPRLDLARQRAAVLCHGLTALRRGLRRDQIAEALHRSKIELVVGKRPACEFARLCRSKSINSAKYLKDGGKNGAAAMQVQLRHVLAGFASRRRKPEHESGVDHAPARRFTKGCTARPARFGNRSRYHFESASSLRSADAHHCDRRWHAAARQRIDRVVRNRRTWRTFLHVRNIHAGKPPRARDQPLSAAAPA